MTTEMTSYCDSDDVKMIINTSLADASITELIVIADADIDRKLSGVSLSDTLKKKCSMMLTAAMIAEGSPKNYTTGDSEIDMGDRAKSWRAEANATIADAVSDSKASARTSFPSSSYQVIDQESRYTVD